MTGPIVAGVMGYPIAHSRSPLLHRTWLKRYGVAGAYVPFSVHPDQLERALRALPALGITGVNLTVPLKEKAANLVDYLDPAATRTGSINMVTVLADGSLEGASSDGYGLLEHLRQSVPTRQANAGPVLVIGTGGAAAAIVDALVHDGETRVRVVNRTDERAALLAEKFGSSVEALPWALRHEAVAGCTLIVNTTTQGMLGHEPLNLTLDLLDPAATVCDIVYTPLETPLLAAARRRGNRVVDGLGMLLHQARPAFARWFDKDPAVDQDLRNTVLASLV